MSERSNGPDRDAAEFPRGKLIATGVIVVFAALGAVIAPLIAPELSWWRTGLGGALLGAFAGGAAVLNRVLE